MRSIVQLFAKSPFKALQEHMIEGKKCVDLIPKLFEALLEGDEERLQEVSKQISKHEHRADEIKNSIRDTLPRNIFLPVARMDLLRVLSTQDNIPDTAEDIAFLLTVRRTFLPPAWRESLFEYVEKCVGTFRAAAEVIESIESLSEVGMTGPEANTLVEKIAAIGQLEWEADKAQFEMLRAMFEMEASLNPVDVYWWSKIFREVGDIANFSEKTVDRVRLMLYK